MGKRVQGDGSLQGEGLGLWDVLVAKLVDTPLSSPTPFPLGQLVCERLGGTMTSWQVLAASRKG